jgi:hypothetical protein
MRYLVTLSALAVALAASGTALAGGWATVGIAPLPDDVHAGGTWQPEITILQHGRTPLEGLAPVVTISEDGGSSQEFGAQPTEAPGVYVASVTFPEAGRWSVVVDSGFGESRLTYGPVTIAEGAPGGDDVGPLPAAGLAVAAAALLLLALGGLVLRRHRRLTPAS